MDRYYEVLSISLSKDIEAFIFLPQCWPTNAGKELDPSSGSVIWKSTLVYIPLIVVSTFFQTPIGSIRPWLAIFRYIPDSYSRGLPICSQVSWVMMFTCDPKSSTTCRTWYPSISRSKSGLASLLSFLFKLQIFFVCFSMLLCFISYNKSMNWDTELSFCTSCINSFIVLCQLLLAYSCHANYLNTLVASLYVYFSFSGSG